MLRVNPYLQNPSSEGMYITWFTTENVDATVTITGKGLTGPLVLGSTVTFEPLLAYTTAEKSETITGLTNSWLINDNNYKHTVAKDITVSSLVVETMC